MTDLGKSFADLRELMSYLHDEDLSDCSDSEFLECVSNFMTNQATDLALFNLAVEHSISGDVFEKWFKLAHERLENATEDQEISDEDLLGLLKDLAN